MRQPDDPRERFGDLVLRDYEPGDEHAILASFNRVFSAVDPNFVPRTLQEWRWAFPDNPAGFEIRIAVAEDGTVAGQFAAIRQVVLLLGQRGRFVQGVDNFTDPRTRRGLRRETVLSALNNLHWERTGGTGPGKTQVAWGLPVEAAWRVGGRLIQYEVIRTQLELQAGPDEVHPRAAPGVEVEEVRAFPAEVDALAERAAAPHGAIELRDRAHCAWRFERRPGVRYRIALARRGPELEGYAVFRRASFDGRPDQGVLVDWLVPRDAERAAHALRAWLRDVALEEGCPRLVGFLPETAFDWLPFQEAGFRAAPTGYFPICRYASRRYDPRWLYHHWYYTLADTDLV